ncbi:MAG: hypothetical protein AB8B91_18300 [Rubripirellula sp.]
MTEPTPSTDSKPLRERLLPQTSIRFMMAMMVASAIVMVVFRQAAVGDAAWAKILSMMIQTIFASFLAYGLLFLIANLFSATTDPIVRALDSSAADRDE